eukprot:6212982-Pleurochrysis_carterae.AAC.8
MGHSKDTPGTFCIPNPVSSVPGGRHLRNGQCSVDFVVDSGCTWPIHPHIPDLVNLRAYCDSAAGIDGRPQRCIAIGDLPLTAIDDAGQNVASGGCCITTHVHGALCYTMLASTCASTHAR